VAESAGRTAGARLIVPRQRASQQASASALLSAREPRLRAAAVRTIALVCRPASGRASALATHRTSAVLGGPTFYLSSTHVFVAPEMRDAVTVGT
jgi:hypothetical protein